MLHSLRQLEVIARFNHRDLSRPKDATGKAQRIADLIYSTVVARSNPHFPRDCVIPTNLDKYLDKFATVVTGEIRFCRPRTSLRDAFCHTQTSNAARCIADAC
jgi:hypothetical protein